MSDLTRFPYSGLQRQQAVKPDQIGTYIWTGSPQVTGLIPSTQAIYNVKDYGAYGDGVHDDTDAIEMAASQLLSGPGVLFFPPGTYLVHSGIALPSNSVAQGCGKGVSTIKAVTNFPTTTDPAYSFFYNENWDAANLAAGNIDISVIGFTFDYSWRTTTNAFASLKMRHVERLLIRDCFFYYGGNAIAVRGCEQTWVQDCVAEEFRNCAWDFWEGPGTTMVLNNVAKTSETKQALNFNPEFSPVASSPLNVVAKRLSVIGNTFLCGDSATMVPCQIEPLGDRDNSVQEVVITGNIFRRTYLVARQQSTLLVIANNTFDDFTAPTSTSAIVVSPLPLISRDPNTVVIAHNVINQPSTTAGNFGVIWCDAEQAVVTGNVITGTTYDAQPFYQGAATPNHFGNYYEKRGITGRMRQGFVLSNPNNVTDNPRSAFAWEDLSGNLLRMYMAGNFHQFWDNARQIWSYQAGSSFSDINFLIGGLFSDHLRMGADNNLTATGTTRNGALQLAKNWNMVTTVPAASGVLLPVQGSLSITGWPVTVGNLGSEILAVYPATNATIDDNATGLHDNIPPGIIRSYVARSSTQWTSIGDVSAVVDLDGDDVSAQDSLASEVDLTTAPETEPPTYEINHVLLYGQSLAIGAEGTPGISTTAKYDNLQFGDSVGGTDNTTPSDVWAPNGGASLTPLAITGSYAEVPIFGALNTYRALTFRSQGITSNADQRMLASSCAIGGRDIADLESGAVPDIFNRLVSCMDQANTYCAGLGTPLTYGVTALVWLQGESDQTTTQAAYTTALQGIYTDFCTAALAETGQTANPAMFMYQTTARNGNYNTTGLGVQMAQLDIGLNDAGCFMVGPVYPYNDSENLHLCANSYRWWASNLGKVMHRVLTLGQEWKPLHITTAEMRGRRILLTYYVPHGPLVFEDPWMQTGWTPANPPDPGEANSPFAVTDRGFTIRDDPAGGGTTMDIASVVLVADNQILITLAADPPVAVYYVYYADGSAGHYGHGAVRDSDPALADDVYLDLQSGQPAMERNWDYSAKRYPLYNWAVAQMMQLTAV